MAETGLLAAKPFEPDAGAPSNAAVTLVEHRSIAGIAVFRNCQNQLETALGLTLPRAGHRAQGDGALYLWAGLENWLAVSDFADPDFGSKLAETCNGLAAVTDQGDGRAILRISGPAARDALAKLLPIDLHPAAFPADATAMTLAGHISVQIWRVGDDSFELYCFRSLSETLYQALTEAIRAF